MNYLRLNYSGQYINNDGLMRLTHSFTTSKTNVIFVTEQL